MSSALHLFLSILLAPLAPSLQASALGDLHQAAGGASANVPAASAPQGGFVSHEDPDARGETWTLHADCSTCPSAWYPEKYPTKGPYASESACLQDLNQAKFREGANSCEKYWCSKSGADGGDAGGSAGAGAIKSGVAAAVVAAKTVAARNSHNGDSGKDLLADADPGEDGARYGIGRHRPTRTPTPRPRPTKTPDLGMRGTVQLLRTPVDLGGPIDPTLDCATYRQELERWRQGLQVQRDALKKTEALLIRSSQSAAEIHEKARERAKEFASGAALDLALEANKKYHLLQKGLAKALAKEGLSREQRALAQQLLRQGQRTTDRARKWADVVKVGDKALDAGAEGYMRGSLDGLQASWQAACHDPELREDILNLGGESLAELGGPAAGLAFKTLKFDIDLAAFTASQGLDKAEASEELKALDVMKREVERTEGRIRSLEQQGRAQCEKGR